LTLVTPFNLNAEIQQYNEANTPHQIIMAKERSGIIVGLNRGHVRFPVAAASCKRTKD
jgi:hypothetical protein